MTFLLAPVGGLGREESYSVARCEELWTALGEGRGSAYADRHPDDTLNPAKMTHPETTCWELRRCPWMSW